ncbi:hypothetical protein DFH06DRAFT_1125105 [Mycena polygramma]|nr:hypothetical protein DFH06DRAFT_1125105 [Mycena polygramma]
MSSPYYCSPPIHGASRNLSTKVYLVTSPNAKAPGRGVYPSWEPAQRVSEGVTRGGAVKYDNYNESLPAWHDCCDAGEHNHPANPQGSIPAPPVTPVAPAPPVTPVAPSTPRRRAPAGPSTSSARPVASATPKSRAPAPAAIPQPAAVAALRYAISGTGIVYTDLTDALDHFERVAASRPATFLTTEDSRYAAHFAAGHSETEARALADGERLASEVEIRWEGGKVPYPARLTDTGRRQARTACVNASTESTSGYLPNAKRHLDERWEPDCGLQVSHMQVQEDLHGPIALGDHVNLNVFQAIRKPTLHMAFITQLQVALVWRHGGGEKGGGFFIEAVEAVEMARGGNICVDLITIMTLPSLPPPLPLPPILSPQVKDASVASRSLRSNARTGRKPPVSPRRNVGRTKGSRAPLPPRPLTEADKNQLRKMMPTRRKQVVGGEEESDDGEAEEKEDEGSDEDEEEEEPEPEHEKAINNLDLPPISTLPAPPPSRSVSPVGIKSRSPNPPKSLTEVEKEKDDDVNGLEDIDFSVDGPAGEELVLEDPPADVPGPQQPDLPPPPPTEQPIPALPPLAVTQELGLFPTSQYPPPPTPSPPPPRVEVPPPPPTSPPRVDSVPPPPPRVEAPPLPPTSPPRVDSVPPPPPRVETPPPPPTSPRVGSVPPPPPRVEMPLPPPTSPPRVDSVPPPPPRVETPPLPPTSPPRVDSVPPPPPRVETPPLPPTKPIETPLPEGSVPPPPLPPKAALPPKPVAPLEKFALQNLDSHHERNPELPTQPEPKARGKGVAMENTLLLKKQQKKEARTGLKAVVDLWNVEVEQKAKDLANEFHLGLDEVHAIMSGSSKLKKKRKYNQYNAKVWWRAAELNEGKGPGERLLLKDVRNIVLAEPEGTWSEEDLIQLKKDYEKHQDQKESGLRLSNAEASRDAYLTGGTLHDELILLEKRTGARSLLIIAGSNVNDTIRPQILGSPASCNFVAEVLKMPPAQLPQKLHRWGCFSDDVKPVKGQDRRTESVDMLKSSLGATFGVGPVNMEYIKYTDRIKAAMGVQLIGWPESLPFQALSTIGSGGAEGINVLWERLKNRTCRWVDIEPAQHKGLLVQFPKQAKNWEKTWKPRREAQKLVEAAAAALEGAPAQKAVGGSGKRKRKEKVVEEGGEDGGETEGAPAKKKKDETPEEKKKRKAAKKKSEEEKEDKGGEEEEMQEPPKKRKKSKKAVKETGEAEAEGGEEVEGAKGKKKTSGKRKRVDEEQAANGQAFSASIVEDSEDEPQHEKGSGDDEREKIPDLNDPNLNPHDRAFFAHRLKVRAAKQASAVTDAKRQLAVEAATARKAATTKIIGAAAKKTNVGSSSKAQKKVATAEDDYVPETDDD